MPGAAGPVRSPPTEGQIRGPARLWAAMGTFVAVLRGHPGGRRGCLVTQAGRRRVARVQLVLEASCADNCPLCHAVAGQGLRHQIVYHANTLGRLARTFRKRAYTLTQQVGDTPLSMGLTLGEVRELDAWLLLQLGKPLVDGAGTWGRAACLWVRHAACVLRYGPTLRTPAAQAAVQQWGDAELVVAALQRINRLPDADPAFTAPDDLPELALLAQGV